ncbi:sugar ABC transporter ATP-binding protein [Uliginosibacterium gangwonense]|uniref:sugar ABC transporter ATP-binding protein n=1 Tax=Uliginosibacterium gangwonense TaxID=392736 RepID=UPI0003A2FC43|nr:sugar ABC transporter ATP-binding protein [Uliginosibacterium gangwonense]
MPISTVMSDISQTPPVLQLRQIHKRFGATVALAGVDLSIHAGEIVALMGANGAGKSTLVKVISGAHQPDAGDVFVRGMRVSFKSPRTSFSNGIVTVYQNTNLLGVPGLSIAENLLLDQHCGGRSRIWQTRIAIHKEAKRIADALDLHLDLEADFLSLTPAERQLLALARALHTQAQLVILDEPTASLSQRESAILFAAIDRLRQQGVAILYVSHRLEDLRKIADRAVVIRNGRVAAEFSAPLDLNAAVQAMMGSALHLPAPRAQHFDVPVLQIRNLRLTPSSTAFDLSVHDGEIVVVTGNLGSGKTRLLKTLFGLMPVIQGEITLDGHAWHPATPRDAIRDGVFMAGEDRWKTSFLPQDSLGASIADVIAFPHLDRLFPHGLIRQKAIDEIADQQIRALGIRCTGGQDKPEQLSGGNQQKVVVARWQSQPSRLLLLDEPFQGVDVGARQDLITAIRKRKSGATLIATSDLEEALEVGDRIIVLKNHEVISGISSTGSQSLLSILSFLEEKAA